MGVASVVGAARVPAVAGPAKLEVAVGPCRSPAAAPVLDIQVVVAAAGDGVAVDVAVAVAVALRCVTLLQFEGPNSGSATDSFMPVFVPVYTQEHATAGAPQITRRRRRRSDAIFASGGGGRNTFQELLQNVGLCPSSPCLLSCPVLSCPAHNNKAAQRELARGLQTCAVHTARGLGFGFA